MPRIRRSLPRGPKAALFLFSVAALLVAFAAPGAQAAPGDTTWVRTFDHDFYNWPTVHEQTFTLPDGSTNWQKILLRYQISCPGDPADCDPWDRLGWMQVLHDTGEVDSLGMPILEPFEIARVITPYDITGGLRPDSCAWVLDVTDYKTMLRGDVTFRSAISSWIGDERGWLVTTDFAFVEGDPPLEPYRVVNLWTNYYTVYGDPDRPIVDALQPVSVALDAQTVAAKLRVTTTGHGQGNTDNCAEFCQKEHTVIANGDSFSHILWRSDCNLNPCSPQGGTWPGARAGWCPGDAVAPWDVDITTSITPGGTAILDYDIQAYENFCRPTNPDCVDGVTCAACAYNGTGHTEPNYAIQAQLILYADAATDVPWGQGATRPDPEELARMVSIGRAAPNPFNPRTEISYTITRAQPVTVGVYDASGRLVRRIEHRHAAAGTFTVHWDGRDDSGAEVMSGLYYLRVQGSGASASEKMVLIR